jgi:sugar phosphate isomerase/epimerase
MRRKHIALLIVSLLALGPGRAAGQPRGNIHETPRLRIALNYYSFNSPLNNGAETIESVIDYAAGVGFDAVDLTGYYFAGYPAVPSDERIARVRLHASGQGVTICGTGVRNDFALADPAARAAQIAHVKEWVVVAHKLGASTLRVFAGSDTPEGHSREETNRWVAAAIDECARWARPYGITLAVQNHNDFLKTAGQVDELFSLVASGNVGLMLDVGSYRTDPYRETEQTIGYAVSWQIKENVYIDRVETPTDIERLVDIMARGGYRGFVPIETLGVGNERQRVKTMFERVDAARRNATSK